MDSTIRKGRSEDFPQVLALIRALALYEKAPEKVTNSVEQMETEQDYFDFFVAESDGKIIGFALYFFAYYTWVGKSLYLDDLFVKEEFRGKGIGYQLLRKLFEVAKAENCQRMRWQVLDWNIPAIEFYRKNNATIDEEWFNCDYDRAGILAFLEE